MKTKVLGPYSPAVSGNGFIFCSGQIGEGVEIEEQTKNAINNLKNVLEKEGCGIQDIVKTEVFLKDMSDFEKMNSVYSEMFVFDPKPARSTVGVSALPKGALIEISCIAVKK